jgi:molybdopterin synthase sulfur carrier subunit
MKSVEVFYFALLREKAGKESEKIDVEASTYQDLYEELSSQYSFDLPCSMIHLAVDDEFHSMNSPIADNAKIVFIPPVAGG